MSRFYEIEPNLQNYWRAVILFGRNSASYKFALAKALYDLKDFQSDIISIADLAPHFSKHITEHLAISDKQSTSASSKFLDVCRSFNKGEISQSDLIAATERMGFENVIDAFHNVHGSEINTRFFLDERKTNNGIRLTDDFRFLAETKDFDDLHTETESRWRLVETAWELGLNKNIVNVSHDNAANELYVQCTSHRRVDITSSRSALNGYQKGRCFYCYRNISIIVGSEHLADVDHFFPHKLKECANGKPVDGVANLVLACQSCNRGVEGKFDRIPSIHLLERLHARNEYLIQSHHPLSETLKLQTGLKAEQRQTFLQDAYNCAKLSVIHTWQPKAQGIATF